jgi:hypothetical protein
MNEIDLWDEAEGMFMEGDTDKDKDIAYNLFQLFEWSDNPTSEDDFDEIYNRIFAGEQLKDILKERKADGSRIMS